MNWYLAVSGILASLLFALFMEGFNKLFRKIVRKKGIVKQQTYEQLRRSRDSLLFVFAFVSFWMGVYLHDSVELILYLGFWTGPVFFSGLIVLELLVWSVYYLLDRWKSTAMGPDMKAGGV